MSDRLVAYVLGQLEESDQALVEAEMESNPRARRQVELLRQAISPLAADPPSPPPPGLVIRTITRVAEHLCQPKELPVAPALKTPAAVVNRSWWGRADVLMAACLLIAVLGLGIFGIYRLRAPDSASTRLECANNLRQLYSALNAYHDQQKTYPNVAAEAAPRNVAGMVIPLLCDAGVLPKEASLSCPGTGRHEICNLTLDQLRKAPADEFSNQHADKLIPCYAYGLGYYDEDQKYHPPAKPQDSLASQQYPLLADQPNPNNPLIGNSQNHGGAGQNVLFADGSVRFLSHRNLGEDNDIFTNRKGQLAAGLGAKDFCLGSSRVSPGNGD